MHINYEGLCGQSLSDRNNIKHHIEELVKSAGFPYHQASLADIFIPGEGETCLAPQLQELRVSKNEDEKTPNEQSDRTKQLYELFEKVKTITAKEDLLQHLFRNVVERIAKGNGYDYIMLGDCGSNIAVRILADIAQGRGSQLPYSVAFKDGRSAVPVLRPMREFTKKEIQFYNCFSNVTSFTIPSFTTKAFGHASIHRLTEALIVGLQASFPSTVNTVLKTGDKISSNLDSGDGHHCALCLAPLALRSVFSEVLSESKMCSGNSCGSGGECQKTDGDGVLGCQKDDGDMYPGSGDGNGAGCQKSDGSSCVDGTSVGTDGDHECCQRSDGDFSTIDDGGGALQGAGSHSDVPEITSSDDSSFAGTVASGGTSGHASTFGDGKHTESIQIGGALIGTGDYSGISDVRIVGDQSTDDHNVLVNSLCYGCKLTYNDIENGQMLLPEFVTKNSRKRFERKAMKEQIENFLIDD